MATEIPYQDLTPQQVARLWAQDRQALGECVSRHSALAAAVAALEGQGAGNGARQ